MDWDLFLSDDEEEDQPKKDKSDGEFEPEAEPECPKGNENEPEVEPESMSDEGKSQPKNDESDEEFEPQAEAESETEMVSPKGKETEPEVQPEPTSDNEFDNVEPDVPLQTAEMHTNFAVLDGEDMKAVGLRLMPLSSTWKSKEDLKDVISKYGLAFGFKVCCSGWSFSCNKAGETRDRKKEDVPEDKRRHGRRHLKVGCKMTLKYTYVARLDNRQRDKRGPVRVTFSDFTHTGSCVPSANQLLGARKASGDYSKMTDEMMASVLTVMKHDPGISTRALRAMLRTSFPNRVSISALQIFNMKVRLRLLHEQKEQDGLLAKHKTTMTALFRGLDDVDSDIIDNASKHVDSIVRNVLNSSVDGWKFLHLLENMHLADPGFTYRISYDCEGVPSGAVWMTPQMRSNYELFGSFISIDAMKRQQNSLHWPYIAPVVLDERKTVAVIAESIVCGERLVAYEFVLRSIFEMAPNRPKSDIYVLAGDCFVAQSLLETLGIADTCHLMWDHYHIIESVWPTKFGIYYFNASRSLLSRLLNAYTETIFEETLAALFLSLSENPDLVTYMEGWAANRKFYATYLLRSYPGSMGRKGSSPSEQNHSSYVATIGSGFVDDPCIQLEKMVQRQNELNRKRNEGISTYSCKSQMEMHRAVLSGDETMADALNHLSLWGMELWNKEYNEALNYHAQSLIQDNDDHHSIQRLGSDAPPRVFSKKGRCDCNTRIAFMFPCGHEICADGLKFVSARVNKRWLKRTTLTSSYDTGHPAVIDGPFDVNLHSQSDTVTNSEAPQQNQEVWDTQLSQQQSQQTKSRTKGQEYNELMSLSQSLAQAAAGSKFGCVVGGIIIKLTQAIEGNAEVEVGDGSWPSVLQVFSGALETFRNAFSGRRTAGNALATGLPLQPIAQTGRPQAKRFQSNIELAGKKRKKAVLQSCGFCGSLDHQRQTACPVMAALGTKIINIELFLSYLMGNAPYSDWEGRAGMVMKNVPTGGRHLVVHRKFSTYIAVGSNKPELIHSVIEATVIDKTGLALPNYNHKYFEGPAIIKHIGKISDIKNRHVFSTMQDMEQVLEVAAVTGNRA
jgi:hypothetical protein